MTFDPDLAACADRVRKGDADRFMATMAAPLAARRVLFPIYAMNVEIARAPWVSSEPMIAEMRLQWWRDTLADISAGTPVRRHEIATPLAAVLTPEQAARLDEMVKARRRDILTDPFDDADQLHGYISHTAGTLMQTAATALGAPASSALRDFGHAAGLAAWLCAVPELTARRQKPLPDPSPGAIRALAEDGLARLARARPALRSLPAPARPALLAGWQAAAILRRARLDPQKVATGPLGPGDTHKRLLLILRAATNRW